MTLEYRKRHSTLFVVRHIHKIIWPPNTARKSSANHRFETWSRFYKSPPDHVIKRPIREPDSKNTVYWVIGNNKCGYCITDKDLKRYLFVARIDPDRWHVENGFHAVRLVFKKLYAATEIACQLPALLRGTLEADFRP